MMEEGWMMGGWWASSLDEVTLEELVVMQFNFLPNSCFLPLAHSLRRHLKWREKGGEEGGAEGGGEG